MNDFWKTWLDIWCLGIIAFGGGLSGAGFVRFEGGVRLFLSMMNPTTRLFSMMLSALPLA